MADVERLAVCARRGYDLRSSMEELREHANEGFPQDPSGDLELQLAGEVLMALGAHQACGAGPDWDSQQARRTFAEQLLSAAAQQKEEVIEIELDQLEMGLGQTA